MRIYPALAREAVLQVSGPYGGDADRTAAAILRVANANMERALRVVSVERGHDPRDFTLVPFGGAGGLHACDLADAVRMNRILVPRHPGVLSALGMATAPVVSEHSAAVLQAVDPGSDGISQLLAERFEALASEATEALNAGDLDPAGASMERSLEMRYMGQSFELNIAIQDTSPSHLLPLFHEAHQERYGHSHPDRTVEVVTARLRLSLPANTAPISVRVGPEPVSHPIESVATQLVGWASTSKVRRLETPFYRRSEIMPGAEIVGPAVIVQMDSTCLIAPSWRATVDGAANLVLARRDQPLR
jgi:N-methylhydantoinase A